MARSDRALGECGLWLLLHKKLGAAGEFGKERDMTCINSFRTITLAAEWKID